MQIQRAVQAGGLAGVLLLAGALLCAVLWYYPQWQGLHGSDDRQALAFKVVPVIAGLVMLVLGGSRFASAPLVPFLYQNTILKVLD